MNKKQFKELLQEEKTLYLGTNPRQESRWKRTHHKRYTIWRYLCYFRWCQYWEDVRKDPQNSGLKKIFASVMFRRYDRLRNIYSEKSGVEIALSSKIGRNCDIWHSGVVINGNLGDACLLHGNNIIGNKGNGQESERPTLGNKVDVGAGASIIGNLQIADGCFVGAGAVVTKSFDQPGSVLVGVPARKIK